MSIDAHAKRQHLPGLIDFPAMNGKATRLTHAHQNSSRPGRWRSRLLRSGATLGCAVAMAFGALAQSEAFLAACKGPITEARLKGFTMVDSSTATMGYFKALEMRMTDPSLGVGDPLEFEAGFEYVLLVFTDHCKDCSFELHLNDSYLSPQSMVPIPHEGLGDFFMGSHRFEVPKDVEHRVQVRQVNIALNGFTLIGVLMRKKKG